MFGTLLAFGMAGVSLGSAFAASGTDDQKKKEAMEKGEVYYVDHRYKWRSVQTNEIVTMSYCDSRYSGHDVLVGCETGRIYQDLTKEKQDAENAKLKAEGKPWYWKEYPHTYGDFGSKDKTPWKSCFLPYDPIAGMPFRLMLNPMRRYSKNEKRWMKEYYDVTTSKYFKTLVKTEYLDEEEARQWNHIGSCRNF